MGVRVPEDIALIGFDGTYEAIKHDPPLTTVRQPCLEIAHKVQDLILKWADHKEEISHQEFQIPPVLLAGGSV
jgi:LacI family transcriptional regulator